MIKKASVQIIAILSVSASKPKNIAKEIRGVLAYMKKAIANNATLNTKMVKYIQCGKATWSSLNSCYILLFSSTKNDLTNIKILINIVSAILNIAFS